MKKFSFVHLNILLLLGAHVGHIGVGRVDKSEIHRDYMLTKRQYIIYGGVAIVNPHI